MNGSRIGHATEDQEARIRDLESTVRQKTASPEQKRELALLLIEPGHQPVRAAELLEELTRSENSSPRAMLWLAFVYVYKLMQRADLQAAISLADAVLQRCSEPDDRAAALMLKAAATRQLESPRPIIPDLEQSVALAPSWIGNRQLLAQVYIDNGNLVAAREQLTRALENTEAEIHPQNYDDELFELLITARAAVGVADRIERQLKSIHPPRTHGACE